MRSTVGDETGAEIGSDYDRGLGDGIGPAERTGVQTSWIKDTVTVGVVPVRAAGQPELRARTERTAPTGTMAMPAPI